VRLLKGRIVLDMVGTIPKLSYALSLLGSIRLSVSHFRQQESMYCNYEHLSNAQYSATPDEIIGLRIIPLFVYEFCSISCLFEVDQTLVKRMVLIEGLDQIQF